MENLNNQNIENLVDNNSTETVVETKALSLTEKIKNFLSASEKPFQNSKVALNAFLEANQGEKVSAIWFQRVFATNGTREKKNEKVLNYLTTVDPKITIKQAFENFKTANPESTVAPLYFQQLYLNNSPRKRAQQEVSFSELSSRQIIEKVATELNETITINPKNKKLVVAKATELYNTRNFVVIA